MVLRLVCSWSVALCLLIGLPQRTSAQEIVFVTPETALDSVHDNPIGGAAETIVDVPFISLQSTREWRAFAEYDVTAAAGAVLSRARISGDIAVNNSVDRGTRTIEISIYDADGTVTLSDFDAATTPLGTVSYHPPPDTRVSFSYDILTQVDALIAAGATHIGFRARSTSDDAPNVFDGLVLEIATLCGNSVVDGGEDCDDGASNSDVTPDACRTDCTAAGCGDGVVDTGEGCDDGVDNGPMAACTDACVPAGSSDAGSDAAAPDSGLLDSGATDTSVPDAAPPDTRPSDTSASPDTSAMRPPGSASCACRVTPIDRGDLTSLLLVAIAFGVGRNRRRRR